MYNVAYLCNPLARVTLQGSSILSQTHTRTGFLRRGAAHLLYLSVILDTAPYDLCCWSAKRVINNQSIMETLNIVQFLQSIINRHSAIVILKYSALL